MASPADPRKPPFPKPFVDYVMEYHKSHTNSLRFACIVSRRDISPFAAQLAPYFQHVHVHLVQEEDSFGGKEVQQTDLKSVREALTAHHDEHWEQARFTISAGLTTALYSAIPSRSVDMMFFDDWHWDEEGK